MYYVYILTSLKYDFLYTGYTSNLKLRLKQHAEGGVKSTRYRRPLKLVYYQAFKSEKDARAEERYLKSGGKAKNDLKLRIKHSLTMTR